MRLDPPDPNQPPLGIPWRQWGRWALFVAAIAIIVTVALVGVSAKKPWLWTLFPQ